MLKHFPPTFGKFVCVPNLPEYQYPVCAKDIFFCLPSPSEQLSKDMVGRIPKKLWLGIICPVPLGWGVKLIHSQQNSKFYTLFEMCHIISTFFKDRSRICVGPPWPGIWKHINFFNIGASPTAILGGLALDRPSIIQYSKIQIFWLGYTFSAHI